MDLFSPPDAAAGGERLLDHPPLLRFPGLLGPAADEALARLDAELDWQRPVLRLYGRDHPIPRRQVWMGDAAYRYSGRDFAPAPWHPVALALRDAVVARLAAAGHEARFNSVLLNRYADGEERMGWHCDDEPELGEAPRIAAVSLLLMGPGVQDELEHALLPRRGHGLRISLTFRWVQLGAGEG